MFLGAARPNLIIHQAASIKYPGRGHLGALLRPFGGDLGYMHMYMYMYIPQLYETQAVYVGGILGYCLGQH